MVSGTWNHDNSIRNRKHQSTDTTHFRERELVEVCEALAESIEKKVIGSRKEVRATLVLELRRDELVHDVEHAQNTGRHQKCERGKPRPRGDGSDLSGLVERLRNARRKDSDCRHL